MNKALFFFLLSLTLGLNACIKDTTESDKKVENEQEIQAYIARKNISARKTESGLYYAVTPGSGTRVPAEGDQVQLHYVLSRIADDVIIDSSRVSRNQPLKLPFGSIVGTEGLREGISLLKEGDKAVLLLPSSLAFGSRGSAGLLPYSTIRYDVNVLKIRSEEEQIQEYLQTNNLRVDERTETGLRFTLLQKSTLANADTVKATDTQVFVTYTGTLLDGTQFDSNASSTTGTAFNVSSETSSIKGFREGLLKGLREGDKVRIIFPSSLGYEKAGRINQTTSLYTIQPYSPLQFEIEIKSITR